MSEAVLWNEIGNLYLIIGSPEDAIAAYAKAVEVNPESGWAYSNLGHAYFLKGEFGHALQMFRKSIQFMDTPENQAIVWNKIGDAYRALKDIDNAIQAYKKADDLDMRASPSEKKSLRQPGNPIAFIGNNMMEKQIPNSSDQKSVIPNIITGNSLTGDHPYVEGFTPDGIDEGPGDTIFTTSQPEQGDVVFPKQNKKTSLEDPIMPVDKSQNSTKPATNVGNTLNRKEKPLFVIPEPDEKVDNLQREGKPHLEHENTNNLDRLIDEGKTKDEKPKGGTAASPVINDLEEILAKVNIYENITRTNPTNDRGWDTLGKLYKTLGRYSDAIGAYKKAIEMAPDREVYYYYLGLLYSVEQQDDEAIKAFQMVLQKNPEYILAHSALAGVYHRVGLENKANHHIAIALPKMNNESTYNRACFYAICGDRDLAFEFLILALKNKDTTIDWIISDPDLDPLRPDPRYQELISDRDQSNPENLKDNYYSSGLDGKPNRLLPILNHSLER
jgi:tetratricopeptide (TPR) repeat protein